MWTPRRRTAGRARRTAGGRSCRPRARGCLSRRRRRFERRPGGRPRRRPRCWRGCAPRARAPQPRAASPRRARGDPRRREPCDARRSRSRATLGSLLALQVSLALVLFALELIRGGVEKHRARATRTARLPVGPGSQIRRGGTAGRRLYCFRLAGAAFSRSSTAIRVDVSPRGSRGRAPHAGARIP